MYSIQLDTTQDISSKYQCSVIVLYVDQLNVVKERLLAMIDAEASTGAYYVSMLKTCLDDTGIDVTGEVIQSITLFSLQILTAHIFMRLFSHTSILSKYLQTSGL